MSKSAQTLPDEQTFKQQKESGEAMVNRLREWRSGETIWGYDIITENNASSGKTFKRGETGIVPIEMKFVEAVETRLVNQLEHCRKPCVGFVWCGTIDRVRVEAPSKFDPGEPPLMFAAISDVVVKSTVRLDGQE